MNNGSIEDQIVQIYLEEFSSEKKNSIFDDDIDENSSMEDIESNIDSCEVIVADFKKEKTQEVSYGEGLVHEGPKWNALDQEDWKLDDTCFKFIDKLEMEITTEQLIPAEKDNTYDLIESTVEYIISKIMENTINGDSSKQLFAKTTNQDKLEMIVSWQQLQSWHERSREVEDSEMIVMKEEGIVKSRIESTRSEFS